MQSTFICPATQYLRYIFIFSVLCWCIDNLYAGLGSSTPKSSDWQFLNQIDCIWSFYLSECICLIIYCFSFYKSKVIWFALVFPNCSHAFFMLNFPRTTTPDVKRWQPLSVRTFTRSTKFKMSMFCLELTYPFRFLNNRPSATVKWQHPIHPGWKLMNSLVVKRIQLYWILLKSTKLYWLALKSTKLYWFRPKKYRVNSSHMKTTETKKERILFRPLSIHLAASW